MENYQQKILIIIQFEKVDNFLNKALEPSTESSRSFASGVEIPCTDFILRSEAFSCRGHAVETRHQEDVMFFIPPS